jgi:hypothetical protein
LFALIAVRLRLASLEQVSRALSAWRTRSETSVAQVLMEQGALDEHGGLILASAVEHHLGMTEGDAVRGLGAFSGSDAMKALSAVLEQTVNLPVPDALTVVRSDGDTGQRAPAGERAGDRGCRACVGLAGSHDQPSRRRRGFGRLSDLEAPGQGRSG